MDEGQSLEGLDAALEKVLRFSPEFVTQGESMPRTPGRGRIPTLGPLDHGSPGDRNVRLA